MSIIRVLLYIFLAIFIYKFVIGFLVPVIKMSWRVRSQIKEFQRQQQQQQEPLQQNNAANNNRQSTADTNTASSPKAGEYIDFEEVKE